MLVLLRRQIDDQHSGPAVDERDQPDRAAGEHIGDEQLFAVDYIFIAVAHRAGSQRGQVGAGAGFGQRECRETLAVGQPRQKPLFLLGVAKRAHRIDRPDAAMHRRQPGHCRIDHRHARDKRREAAERRPTPAVRPIDEQAPIAGGG